MGVGETNWSVPPVCRTVHRFVVLYIVPWVQYSSMRCLFFVDLRFFCSGVARERRWQNVRVTLSVFSAVLVSLSVSLIEVSWLIHSTVVGCKVGYTVTTI